MHTNEIQRIKHMTNTEVVRRGLIQYFITKGFQSFDRLIFPPDLADLPIVLSLLSDKVEIIPHAMNIDGMSGRAELGWNLFVLGTHRMFIGKTYHNNLRELAMQIKNGDMPFNNDISASHQTTPRRIITFIIKVLGTHENGYIDLKQPVKSSNRSMAPKSMMTSIPQSNQYSSLT
jgi:hypothetical protein